MFFHKKNKKISYKLLAGVLLISSLFTLALTGTLLYSDYMTELDDLDERMSLIQRSYIETIAFNHWHVDEKEMNINLQGLLNLPDIVYVAVTENNDTLFEKGLVPVNSYKKRNFPLIVKENGKEKSVGNLVVYATLTGINAKIIDKISLVLASQFLKTFATSFFIVMLFNLLLTRHLYTIKEFFDNFDPSLEKPKHLKFAGRRDLFPDEIDYLGASINNMASNLRDLYKNMDSKIIDRTKQLSEKTKDMQNMLQNMKQGVFTIVKGNKIHKEYSKHLELIFNQRNLEGQDAVDLICKNSNLMSDNIYQLNSALRNSIGDKALSFKINKHLLPKEITKKIGSKEVALELEWEPIVQDKDGLVSKIMVIVRDVTEIRDLEKLANLHKEDVAIIEHLLGNDSNTNKSILDSSSFFIGLISRAIKREKVNVDEVFRYVHTIKGEARTAGYALISCCAHILEEDLDFVRRGDTSLDLEKFKKNFDDLKVSIDKYWKVFYDKLGGDKIEDDRALKNLEACIKVIDNTDNHSDTQMNLSYKKIVSILMKHNKKPINEVISSSVKNLGNMADTIGKKEPSVYINGDSLWVNKEQEKLINNVLNHCLRNSLDHGIEGEEERRIKKKSVSGNIDIMWMETQEAIVIKIADDGAGLNIKKLREKGLEKGLISEQSNENEIANIIYFSDVSTVENVTEISGRGVGLDAVKTFLKENGGDINVFFSSRKMVDGFRPFYFEITIPKQIDAAA